jgi:hypothetical protein
MSSEKLTGPKKAKLAIDDFEAWLTDRCKEPQEKDKILAEYQFQTGHAIRKLNEWIDAIRSKGHIKLVRNSSIDYIVWTGSKKEEENRQPRGDYVATVEEEMHKDEEEKARVRKQMLEGPCKGKCTNEGVDDCRQCSGYVSLQYTEQPRKIDEDDEQW